MDICLRSLMQGPQGWGQREGCLVRAQLHSLISSCPGASILRVSLQGIACSDVSFARASVIELARIERGRLGFCLTDVSDADILENWDGAARGCEQPLMVCKQGVISRMLGPEPSAGLRAMLQYVLSVPDVRTSEAAATLHLKVPNASNKLK